MNINRNNLKIQKKNWGLKIGKKARVPLAFFPIFSSIFFLFEFSCYYDWNSSRNIKRELKRCRLLHYLINAPKMRKKNAIFGK